MKLTFFYKNNNRYMFTPKKDWSERGHIYDSAVDSFFKLELLQVSPSTSPERLAINLFAGENNVLSEGTEFIYNTIEDIFHIPERIMNQVIIVGDKICNKRASLWRPIIAIREIKSYKNINPNVYFVEDVDDFFDSENIKLIQLA